MFEQHDGVLHCKTVMRSNDVMWGVAHDVFMFTILQRTVADFFDWQVGEYRHSAYSSHLYMRDWDAVDKMHPPTQEAAEVPSLAPYVRMSDLTEWSEVQQAAESLIVGDHLYDDISHYDWWRRQASTWQEFL